MDLSKLSPALPKRSSWRKRFHLPRTSKVASGTRQDGQDVDEEIRRIEQLVLELCSQLDRSEKKVEAHLREIDRNLATLAIQKEQIRILERSLGIERQG
ncbi:MAG TPA: hypothetical protein VF173_18360 [Thermoanaerobaculia bacterium]|nr:hypothetical protein [Thermoanaerobaculia bacterium]